MADVPATDQQVGATARASSGDNLYEIRDLKKHFPLTSGIVFRKQVGAVHAFEREGADRWTALHRMTVEYVARMHTNTPVHEWEPV